MYVYAKWVCSMGVSELYGLPTHAHPNGVSLAVCLGLLQLYSADQGNQNIDDGLLRGNRKVYLRKIWPLRTVIVPVYDRHVCFGVLCVTMVVCCMRGCSFPSVRESDSSSDKVSRSVWSPLTRFGSVRFGSVLLGVLLGDTSTCDDFPDISFSRTFCCLGTACHNVPPQGNGSITVTASQCFSGLQESSVRMTGISRPRAVLYKLGMNFCLCYCLS